MKKLLCSGLALATMMLTACGDPEPVPANSVNVSAPPYRDTQSQ